MGIYPCDVRPILTSGDIGDECSANLVFGSYRPVRNMFLEKDNYLANVVLV